MSWRLLETGFQDAGTNMAIDEAILFTAEKGFSTLRLYGWRPPAFSCGYSQKIEQEIDGQKCKELGIDCVKRISGGGVVFHCNELTYSLVAPADFFSARVLDSFKIICRPIFAIYKKLGLKPQFAIDFFGDKKMKRFSPFCLSSCSPYDIIVDGKKIGGNAQRRKKGIIFQHGFIPLTLDLSLISVLLKRQISNIETISLQKALGRKIEFKELSDLFKKSVCQEWGISLKNGELSKEEKEKIFLWI